MKKRISTINILLIGGIALVALGSIVTSNQNSSFTMIIGAGMIASGCIGTFFSKLLS